MSQLEEIERKLQQLEEQNRILAGTNEELRTLAAADPARTPQMSAHAIRPHLAPFWSDRPAAWFAHIESNFALAHITADETKYNYVVGQMDARLSKEMEDLVINPPPKGERNNPTSWHHT
ncbi:uncharacterized protein [Choristoneura fumiferana]|uniref:uncharacterized protein n=1 Tax=Choristoneura fumiferana TaxID=7141 RepID=UPI003D15585A